MGPDVTLIDPGREAARTARTWLEEQGLLRDGQSGEAHYFVSDSTDSFRQLAGWFLGEYAGGEVRRIRVDDCRLELEEEAHA